ncbi:50S ribosomal protein L15 [Catenovulum agarivorans DS-2]|uniref:50S ribosomal protein L15 n=1 Tax=Catenovulum agarivorans DS-2 TaxID=1328313 RepID=W7QTQ5_9ALTE|nr:transporter substrate-binding domain-containing protein [Catenovulum agarivorans]EWH08810.1 50S ribosomal protein L15 [Catenovulum agarivorans DS-2]
MKGNNFLMLFLRVTSVAMLCLLIAAKAFAFDLKVPKPSDPAHNHKIALLKLVVQHAPEHNINLVEIPTGNRRYQISLIDTGDLDLMWAPKNNELEQQMRAVQVALDQDVLGVTGLIVRKSDVGRFSALSNINQLKSLKAGVQKASVTRRILEAHNFTAVSTLRGSFAHMLDGGRFDYYLTPIFKAQTVVDRWAAQENIEDVMVHPDVLIKLPLTSYFYVRKDNQRLASIITDALHNAIESGDFEALLKQSHEYKAAEVYLNNQNQTIFDVTGSI